jgi:hypothetical protein
MTAQLLMLAAIGAVPAVAHPQCNHDWLLAADDSSARAKLASDSRTRTTINTTRTLTLSNGLLQRTFTTSPGFGTLDLRNLRTGDSALRHILPEASLRIAGMNYTLGGLSIADVPSPTGPKWTGQHAFLNRTDLASRLRVARNAWTYAEHWVSTELEPDLPWVPGRRHSPTYVSWPPTGTRLTVQFAPPAGSPAMLKALNVTLVYELYDGAPMMSKWLEITAMDELPEPVLIDEVVTERLALNCDHSPQAAKAKHTVAPRLEALLTAAHGAEQVWTTGANSSYDPGACEPVFSAEYSGTGPAVLVGGSSSSGGGGGSNEAGGGARATSLMTQHFKSFRTILLLHDTVDPTRQMLGRHQIYRRLAPWIQENPLQLHLTNSTDAAFDIALEQMAEVGFETLVLSFGSGFDYEMQPNDPRIQALKANVEKATKLGIEAGGYDLTVLDRGHKGYGGDVGAQWDRVDPKTHALTADACYASGWRDKLEQMLYGVTRTANLSIVLTDGPYGGGVCAATNHSHHNGAADSVYQQYRLQALFYRTMFSQGKFIRQPDQYYFDGGQHSPLGYSEQQYSLPRWTDLTVSRQGMLDDVWMKPAVMGWMFLPMKPYHAGGDGASFEPYTEHLQSYEFALSQYLGSGCGMTYRGDKLYDSKGDASYHMVKNKVAWFKSHRQILISDIVHIKRPTGQGVDAFLHVNPKLPREKALAMVFNPTTDSLTENLTLPLYYSGLEDVVEVSVGGRAPIEMRLTRDFSLVVSVSLDPKSSTYVLLMAKAARAQ